MSISLLLVYILTFKNEKIVTFTLVFGCDGHLAVMYVCHNDGEFKFHCERNGVCILSRGGYSAVLCNVCKGQH
jgi:hypothetical protein